MSYPVDFVCITPDSKTSPSGGAAKSSCRYSNIGCTVSFDRGNEDDHYATYSSYHSELVVKLTKKRFAEYEEAIQESRVKFEKEKEKSCSKDEFIEELRESLESMKNDVAKLNNEVANLNAKVASLLTKIAELEKEREWWKSAYLKGEKQKKSKSDVKQFSFVFENYSDKRKNSSKWTSDVFSFQNGFSFCIDVYANGVLEASGAAVSVGLVALEGNNDDQLKWPLKANFTLILRNTFGQGIDQTVSECVQWDRPSESNSTKCLTLFSAESNVNQLPNAFIAHKKLLAFLEQDKLNFELLVES